jgi:predicted glutamine amidotransferase
MSHQKAFEGLLWADALRGPDSTGVFGVNRYGNVDYLKTKGATDELFRSKEWSSFKDDIYSQFHMLVGHNRKATKGATTDENAHPFVEGNTILVHNGTLFNHSSLTDKKVDVDSHAILHSIVERGFEKTIEELDGAFTLVWYSAEDKQLQVIRNDQRPLFIANTPGAWVFASEDKMLKWILDREDIKITDMTNCKPGTLYTFDLDKKDTMWYRPLKLRKAPVYVQSTAVYVPPTKTETKEEPQEKKDDSPAERKTRYVNSDFKIGTRILVCGKEIKKLEKPRDGKTHVFLGHWFHDMSVVVRCFITEKELDDLDKTLTPEDDDMPMFQCNINTVITNAQKASVALHCDQMSPVVLKYDMQGREIFEDEFIFTSSACSYCGNFVTFDSLQKGIFKFESEEDHEIMCEHCYDKGLYLP